MRQSLSVGIFAVSLYDTSLLNSYLTILNIIEALGFRFLTRGWVFELDIPSKPYQSWMRIGLKE